MPYFARTSSSNAADPVAPGQRVRRGVARIGIAALVVVLAACGSAPSRRGGYYQDDGPPDKAPVDLAQVADAVPRIEPFHPYANRPYRALGRAYTPMTEDRPYRARGLASWYGRQFHGSRTSTGEIYDMFAPSAAHPTLPLPSYARVTNVRTGASVVVRVNDRGPFRPDRVIDLSYAAAVKLGIVGQGTGEVEVVRLTFDDIRAQQSGQARAPAVPTAAAANPPAAAGATGPWSVQLGAFQQEANAEALRERVTTRLEQAGGALAPPPGARVEHDGSIFRVLVGALADRGAAQQLARQLEQLLGLETLILLAR